MENTTHIGRGSISWYSFPFLDRGSPSGADLTCSGFYFDPGDLSGACGLPCRPLCYRLHHLGDPKIHASTCHPQICEDWVLFSSCRGHLGSLATFREEEVGKVWGRERQHAQAGDRKRLGSGDKKGRGWVAGMEGDDLSDFKA